jgi:hypothetical protein
VAGFGSTTDFPVSPSAFQRNFVISKDFGDSTDAFLTVLNPARSGAGQLVYSTYLSDDGTSTAESVGTDRIGNAYVLGSTLGTFPTTPNAYRPSAGGGGALTISKVNPFASGRASLPYSTYFTSSFIPRTASVTPGGLVYLVGLDGGAGTGPVTADAFQPTITPGVRGLGFLSILNPLLSGNASLVYSTYINGVSSRPGSVDASGSAYVAGFADTGSPVTNAYDANGGQWVGILDPPVQSSVPTVPSTPTPVPTPAHRPTATPRPTASRTPSK